MTALVAPIHTGAVAGAPVRFFKGPSGAPELPWHGVEDLYRALGLPRHVRRQMLQMTQRSWGAELRTVATAEGPVVIAPHYAAQGLLGALKELRSVGARVPAHVEAEYCMAAGDALKKLAGGLPPLASVAFALTAFRNTNGVGGGA